MHACHFSAVRTGMRMGALYHRAEEKRMHLHRSRKERQHRERTLYPWPQSTGFHILIFLQRNTYAFNYLLDFPLWILIIRFMAQWERATSLPSPHPTSVIGLSLHSVEISVSPTLCASVSSLPYWHLFGALLHLWAKIWPKLL